MYFSYFSRACKHHVVDHNDLNIVSIVRDQPSWLPCVEKDIRLAPPGSLLESYNKNEINREEFACKYIQWVSYHITAQRIIEIYHNSVLCGYVSPFNFCHRQVLAGWIKNTIGIIIPELPKDLYDINFPCGFKQLNLFKDGDQHEGN